MVLALAFCYKPERIGNCLIESLEASLNSIHSKSLIGLQIPNAAIFELIYWIVSSRSARLKTPVDAHAVCLPQGCPSVIGNYELVNYQQFTIRLANVF